MEEYRGSFTKKRGWASDEGPCEDPDAESDSPSLGVFLGAATSSEEIQIDKIVL